MLNSSSEKEKSGQNSPLNLLTEVLRDQLYRGARSGGELPLGDLGLAEWVKRLSYHLVTLDINDYTRALIRAIWLAPKFAATDFGSARQRDIAQVWTDTARGFLGEIALQKFLRSNFRIETRLDTRRGELKEFLPSDIEEIKKPNDRWRKPLLNISIKTTKFNGRWLDLPGAQIEHSNVFILVKLGISRFHFLSYLKGVNFFKEKLIIEAQALDELSDKDAQILLKDLPDFNPIPAYIAGFLEKDKLTFPIHEINAKLKGRTRRRIEIVGGVGIFSRSTVRNHPSIQQIDNYSQYPISIVPIIDSLTENSHFLANSGALSYGHDNWQNLLDKM